MNEYMEITTIRTEETIASEIRTIVAQTQKTMLDAAVEIGRRLKEAKELVNHGEWGTWLKEKVDFSQRSASNFMKIFDEYGDKQITIFGAVSNSQTFANLSYSKALALLALPEEEREEFVETQPVDDMSTRELEKRIKELQDEKEKAQQAAEDDKRTFANMNDKIRQQQVAQREAEEKIKKLEEEIQALASKEPAPVPAGIDEEEMKKRIEEETETIKAAMYDLKVEKNNAEQEAANIKIKLHDMEIEQAELIEKAKQEAADKARKEEAKQIEQLKREAEEAAAKLREAERKAGLVGDTNVLRFKFLADQLQKDFHQTVGVISGFEDKEHRQKLKAALKTVLESLIENLEERI